MIDDENRVGPFRHLEFQAELLFNSIEECDTSGGVRRSGSAAGAGEAWAIAALAVNKEVAGLGRVNRAIGEGKIPAASEPRLLACNVR